MSEQQNIDVVRRGYEAFGKGDVDALLALFAEDIEWTSPGPPELVTAGRRRGRQQVAEFFQAVNEMYDVESFEPTTFLADGDRVVVLGMEVARFKPTGARISGDWAHVFTVENGRIVRFQEYLDASAVVTELHAARART